MMYKIVLFILLLTTMVVVVRILKGPTRWDRLLGLNLLSAKFVLMIAALSLLENKYYLLDVGMVYSLLGFISILFISRFLGQGGKI